MNDIEELLTFAEELIHEKIGNYFSDLQRTVLLATLQGTRKTYDQIAEECGYSPKYLKQDIAPKLWQLLSEALNQKITKSNVKAILEHQMRHQLPVISSSLPVALSPVSSASGKGNILLVDDHPENLKLLSDLLEEQGYEVQQAINGKVALQAIAVECPDVILLDIHMPDSDGYTLCQKIKSNPQSQDIPVIFVSALNEAWDKVKGFSVGGSDYITKPFKTVEVLARVENQLKVRHLQLRVRYLQQELEEKNQQLQEALQKLESINYS